LIREEKPHERAAELGAFGMKILQAIKPGIVTSVRGRGLWYGIDIDPKAGTAKDFCKKLKYEGVLCKDTRVQTIRVVPPLTISKEDLEWGLERMAKVLAPI
jgi:ornithine--oxo-acid transaminase